MHVIRSEQGKHARSGIICLAVHEVYARSVGRGGELPVAVTVNYGFFFPQKSAYPVRGKFGDKFFDFVLIHIIKIRRYIHTQIISEGCFFVNTSAIKIIKKQRVTINKRLNADMRDDKIIPTTGEAREYLPRRRNKGYTPFLCVPQRKSLKR